MNFTTAPKLLPLLSFLRFVVVVTDSRGVKLYTFILPEQVYDLLSCCFMFKKKKSAKDITVFFNIVYWGEKGVYIEYEWMLDLWGCLV